MSELYDIFTTERTPILTTTSTTEKSTVETPLKSTENSTNVTETSTEIAETSTEMSARDKEIEEIAEIHRNRLKTPPPKTCSQFLHRNKQVVFCGDGINDCPSLAVADVGVAMGEGASLALEVGDVTLMDSNLSKLVYVINMGTRVVATIKENIALSLICKLVVVGLTFYGKMTLLFAIASDVGVMLLVTVNGMKLMPRNRQISMKRRRKHVKKTHEMQPLAGSKGDAEVDVELT